MTSDERLETIKDMHKQCISDLRFYFKNESTLTDYNCRSFAHLKQFLNDVDWTLNAQYQNGK